MKNVKQNIRKIGKSGFSLVEMLVVIAVIGVRQRLSVTLSPLLPSTAPASPLAALQPPTKPLL